MSQEGNRASYVCGHASQQAAALSTSSRYDGVVGHDRHQPSAELCIVITTSVMKMREMPASMAICTPFGGHVLNSLSTVVSVRTCRCPLEGRWAGGPPCG